MQLRTLTDDELLRHASNQLDPLTGTELEAELVRRFEAKDEEIAYFAEIEDELDEFDLTDDESTEACKAALQFGIDNDIKAVKKLLDVLTEYDIDDPAVLRNDLIRLAKFDQTADDLA
jgi:hypothetical protein